MDSSIHLNRADSLSTDIESFKEQVRADSYPELEKELEDFFHIAAGKLKPCSIFKESYIKEKGEDSVSIDGAQFKSRILRLNLDEVEKVFPYIASCGPELEDFDLSSFDPIAFLWLDTIKEMALQEAINCLRASITETYGLKQFSSMNPGSADTEVWPIEQQRELFSLFGDVSSLIGVELSESCLMQPNKSVSGIFFATEVSYVNCQVCTRKNCPKRRAKYIGTK